MATLISHPASGADDYYAYVRGPNFYPDMFVWQQRLYERAMPGGVRFPNITIPQGTVIYDAILTLYCRDMSSGPTLININTSDNAIAPINIDQYNALSWSSINVLGTFSTTPGVGVGVDVTALVQLILNRVGWASGNAVMFRLMNQWQPTWYEAYAFDDGIEAYYPTLTIRYSIKPRVSFPRKLEVAYPSGSAGLSYPREIEVAYATEQTFDGYAVDSYTSVLLHCDGANGSTTLTDECGTSWECRRQAHIATDTYKYGTASINFDGYDDYAVWLVPGITAGVHYNPFTIEFWILTTDTDGSVLNQGPGSGWSSQTIYMMDMVNGYFVWTLNPSDVPSHSWIPSLARIDNTGWRHIACVRDGTTWRLFIDGTIQGTVTGLSYDVEESIYGMYLGGCSDFVGTPRYFGGNIDEFRFSSVARWTSNFSLPGSKTQVLSQPRKLEVAY